MGRVVVTEFVSLDGVMEAPGGEEGYPHTGWVMRYADVGQFDYKLQEVLDADAHLLGRVTFESFAGAWPFRDGPMADRINAMPKFVVSNTLASTDWNNSTILRGDGAESVRQLKSEFDGELMVVGSRTLVHALQAAGLIDEYRLMIFPIVLGSGGRAWADVPDATEMRLIDTRTYENGIVLLAYQPAGREA